MSKRPFSPRETVRRPGRTGFRVRATERAVQNGLCRAVHVAKDAEERVVKNLLRLCEEKAYLCLF